MPTLSLFDGSEFTVAEGSTSIGRGQSNDILINDKSVSKRHALITVQTLKTGIKKVQLADLHSTNGTYVNGERIGYHDLTDGDQITLGTVSCSYKDD